MEALFLEAAFEGIISLLPVIVGASCLISVACLMLSKVREIFQKLHQKHGIAHGDIRFLQETIHRGGATHIQGIFNTHTNQVRGYERIKADRVEPVIQSALNRSPVVIFD
ncbi:MAG: hypothetical protein F6K31_21795 [Symploca sp. SIO2G7]|nr:hypothetical protein [Symploca sp. SIO2G7]